MILAFIKLNCKEKPYKKEGNKMTQILITISSLYMIVVVLVLTDNTSKKYTDYEKRVMLRKANILHQ